MEAVMEMNRYEPFAALYPARISGGTYDPADGSAGRVIRAIFCAAARLEYAAAVALTKAPAKDGPIRASAEDAAFLLDTYGNSILRLVYSYLHNMADAEDILQETLIRYIRTLPEFDSEAHRKAWLLKVAANLAKNQIAYNSLRKADELTEELAGEQAEDLAFVWEAVRDLPEKQREAVHLFYHEGYSTAEIAQILGEKDATVRSHLKRGREHLRQILKDEYDFG